MKITFIGGGSLRIVKDFRVLALQPFAKNAEIALYDIDKERCEATASVGRQAPEIKSANIAINCVYDLDKALEDSDFVCIMVCPWNWNKYHDNCLICEKHGWIGQVNLSMFAAYGAIWGIELALDIAKRMERVTPNGDLLIFSNPIAILTAAVNKYSSIRAIGICDGDINHALNIPFFMGWPEVDFNLYAETAGLNHFSWVQAASLNGEDITQEMRKAYDREFDPERFEKLHPYLKVTFPREQYVFRNYGGILYSAEGDGLPHLCFYEEELERLAELRKNPWPSPNPPVKSREERVKEHLKLGKVELPDEYWRQNHLHPNIRYSTGVKLMRGLSGQETIEMAATYLNNGAIEDFPNEAVMEYTFLIENGEFKAKNKYRIPDGIAGVTRSLLEHQMLTAEAIAEKDQRKFKVALSAYPMCHDKRKLESFMKDILELNREELADWMK